MDGADGDGRGPYGFGDFVVDVGAREIRRAGQRVAVEPQVFDVLVVLLRERHRVVTKEELLDRVWHTRMVSESALTSRIKALRRALGDDGQTQAVIRTAHGHGFRFVADLAPADGARPARRRHPLDQDVHFCRTADGVRLAYAFSGEGPPLVKVANWLTHLEYDLESPVWRHWYEELGARYRLLRYDERGTGLSDLDADGYTVDDWVDDLEAVVDAAGLDRFPLFGISQGGAVAIEYAVRHPERVTHLVLYGAFMTGPALSARKPEHVREALLMPELAQLGWGREHPIFRHVFTMRFLPEGPPEAWTAFDELQRRTTPSTNAVRFLEAFNAVDVAARAPLVTTPTLVLHARREKLVPPSQGQLIAAAIPDSRFVSLDSPNHLLLPDEPAWPRFLDQVEQFLAS
ncbi:alpha/beta fold hydrolase [Modestobacter sp. I12A-02662]|uniref:alpha/beta fold hydrolase n=1 Tax=Modestobacter sp. I12A-02662 TaxID=1730496 RepID=UPI0034DE7184